jgi:hypothetical protein
MKNILQFLRNSSMWLLLLESVVFPVLCSKRIDGALSDRVRLIVVTQKLCYKTESLTVNKVTFFIPSARKFSFSRWHKNMRRSSMAEIFNADIKFLESFSNCDLLRSSYFLLLPSGSRTVNVIFISLKNCKAF